MSPREGEHRRDIFAQRVADGAVAGSEGGRVGSISFQDTSEIIVIAAPSTPVELATTASSFGGSGGDRARGVQKVADSHQHTITWKGTRYARVSAFVGVLPAAGAVACRAHITVNGTVVASGTAFTVTNPNTGGVGVETELDLSTGDVVGLAISNETDTANITCGLGSLAPESENFQRAADILGGGPTTISAGYLVIEA